MRSLAHLALLGLVCAKNVNNALQPEASDGPLLLKPADYANWPNFTSCVSTSSCPETALVTGDPDSDLVVIFMHTTFDGGWIFMHALLNGWTPSFYAVALDLPGDISKKPVDYDSSCEGLTLNCSKGWSDVVASFHADVQRFAPPGKRLAFVGHSLGGVLMEEYIMRELQPAPERIVLINNPTPYVWSKQIFWDKLPDQTCPDIPEPPLNNHATTYVGKNIPNVSDNQGTMVPEFCVPPNCWQCENDYLTQMNADWVRRSLLTPGPLDEAACPRSSHTCSPLLHTAPAHHSCSPLLHTAPAHHSCTPLLHTAPAHRSCSPLLLTTPAHRSGMPLLLTTPAHHSCTPLRHAAPAEPEVRGSILVFAQLESPNYWQTTTWYEDYMSQNLMRRCGYYKPLAIPHMVIEGIASGAGALDYVATLPLGSAEDQCKLASGLCKYEYVECLPNGEELLSASGISGISAWWPHIDNVSYTRGLIDEYIV